MVAGKCSDAGLFIGKITFEILKKGASIENKVVKTVNVEHLDYSLFNLEEIVDLI